MQPPAVPAGLNRRTLGLALGSMGVVFGDIGTSPIYGFKTAVTQAARGRVGEPEILGVISLTLWALIIVVTVKYVAFMMRADNKGEGGILSLMALAQSAVGRRTRTILVLGMCGAALFYGDAIITPAISVLSAVEGLKTAPGLANVITPSVEIAITLVVLVGLFMVQSRGTAKVEIGGVRGAIYTIRTGDVAILPAGTGHRLIDASRNFLVVGAYPPDGKYDEWTDSRDRPEATRPLGLVAAESTRSPQRTLTRPA